MGIPLIAGREFSRRDGPGAPRVAVINETMARYFFGHDNPIGRRLSFEREKTPDIEIVGVVRDGKYQSLREKVERTLFIPWAQDQGIEGMSFFVRTSEKPTALAATLRASVAALDANLPVYDLKSLETEIAESIYVDRMIAALSSFFGALATVLAAIGLLE